MNITPHTASLPLATVVNPPTEGLRRDNHQREIITQVTALNPSAAEKGVASDKERARTPAQVNEQVDFTNLRKQAEHDASSISDQQSQNGDRENPEQSSQEREGSDSTKPENAKPENNETAEESKEAKAEEQVIQQLQYRDKEVRAHEAAHASVGGSLAGAPSYSFQVGPDGKKYAIGGEVSIDLSSVSGDPQATITKMQKVHAAALAPAEPSTQDIRVAASATQKILAAQTELATLSSEDESKTSTRTSRQSTNDHATLDKTHQHDESNTFDNFINETLAAQEAIVSNPTNQNFTQADVNMLQSNDVIQRAQRVESFYFTVSQGYERPDKSQFELIA